MADQIICKKGELARHYADIKKRLNKTTFVSDVSEEPRLEDKAPERKIDISEEMIRQYQSIPSSPKKILIKRIIAETEDKHGVERGILRRKCRRKPIVKARHEAMFRLKKEANCGYAEIGRIFSMDHTTIIHGVKKHETKYS